MQIQEMEKLIASQQWEPWQEDLLSKMLFQMKHHGAQVSYQTLMPIIGIRFNGWAE